MSAGLPSSPAPTRAAALARTLNPVPAMKSVDPTRPHFTPDELAEVLPAWALGEVRSAVELRAGRSGSPKAVLTCARGRFVLKRRAGPAGVPARVAVSHEAQLWAGRAGVPVARLIPARDGNTLVLRGACVYELGVFVEADPYTMRPAQSRSIGGTLAELHRALRAFAPSAAALPRRVAPAATEPDAGALLARCEAVLGPAAAGPVLRTALRPIHGDFHPGNLAFVGDRVACVFDFDRVCLGTEADELAQACAQASIDHEAAVFAPSLAAAVWAGYTQRAAPDVPGPGSVPAPAPVLPRALGAAMARSVLAEVLAGVLSGHARADASGHDRRRVALALAEAMLDAAADIERLAVHSAS